MLGQALRHRITVQRKTATVNPATGYPAEGWADRLVDEPAEWFAGPGREYLASDALRAAVDGRFVVRIHPGTEAITAGDRVLWDGRVMEVKSPPIPDKTARRKFVVMVAETGTDGA